MIAERLVRVDAAAVAILFLVVQLMPFLVSGVIVTVRRLAIEGDEFTNPRDCNSGCPMASSPLAAGTCTCKCLQHFTWRQDLGKCVESSDCKLTARSGTNIHAFTIPDKSDEALLPDHALRYKGSVVGNQDVYRMKHVSVLGDLTWKISPNSDFYISVVQQGKISVQKVKSRTQQSRIDDYDGTILQFELERVSDSGCLMLKIEGSLTYESGNFPSPVYSSGTQHLSTQSVSAATASTTSSSSYHIVKPSSTIFAAKIVSPSLVALEVSLAQFNSASTTGYGYNYFKTIETSTAKDSLLLLYTSGYSRYQSSLSITVSATSVKLTEGHYGTSTPEVPTRSLGTVYVTPSSELEVSDESKETETALFVGIAVGVAVLFVLVIAVVTIYIRRKSRRSSKGIEVANHEFGSTIFNHAFNNVDDDSHTTYIPTSRLPQENNGAVADRNALSCNNPMYDKPLEPTPLSVNSNDCDTSYEEPVNGVTLESRAPVGSSYGYADLVPQTRSDREHGYSNLLGNPLYEEIPDKTECE